MRPYSEQLHYALVDVYVGTVARQIPSNIIMKSQWLAEVFAELDMTSDVLKILISPDKPYFRLTTDGDAGTTQVVIIV